MPTLNCCSTYFPCIWRHLSYRGTIFYIPSLQKVASKPFSQSCMSLVLWSLLNLWPTKKYSCSSELTNYLFSQIFAFNCCLKSSVTKDGHPLCSLSCTLVLPSLINQHHFLTFLSFIRCTFTMHVNNLPVNFRQTNIFTIYNSCHWPHFTGCKIFIFPVYL